MSDLTRTPQTAPNIKCTCTLSWRSPIAESEPHADDCAITNPVKAAMWQGILATVEALPRETGGTSRSVGEYTDDDLGGSSVKSTYMVGQDDGSDNVYEIVVTVRKSVSHNDDFWGPGGTRDLDDPVRRVVVDGEHYMLGDDNPNLPSSCKGFGGRRYRIEFFDGRTVPTSDLWHQGTIPPKWRERYPDNARFVRPEGGVA